MVRTTLLVTCLIASVWFLTGCESAQKYAEDPFSPITEPVRPLITPLNDTVEDVVAIHKVQPAGLDTTVSVADQKQVTISF